MAGSALMMMMMMMMTNSKLADAPGTNTGHTLGHAATQSVIVMKGGPMPSKYIHSGEMGSGSYAPPTHTSGCV